MDRRQTGIKQPPTDANKIYVTMVGSAPMASLDALMLSLERFRDMLSSDSAKNLFETSVRSIQPDLKSVHAFIDKVYANKDPRYAVTMTGKTLIVEVSLSSDEFLNCIHDEDVNEILAHVTAVGSMPAKKTAPNVPREYTVFKVKYTKGKFLETR